MASLITIEIKNDEDKVVETVQLKRIARSQYKDLIALQQLLMQAFVEYNGATGSVIADEANWKTLIKLGKMLPVIGGNDKEGFDVNKIEHDIVLITRLFFTQAVKEDGSVDLTDGFKPSILAEFYQLDYSGFLQKAVRDLETNKKKDEPTTSEK